MMSRETGRSLALEDHIHQSIHDVLTTPVGSRIMRRSYGSILPDLVDHPANPSNRLRLMNATVVAIMKWEPRVSINSVSVSLAMNGKVQIDIEAITKRGRRSGKPINISVPLQ